MVRRSENPTKIKHQRHKMKVHSSHAEPLEKEISKFPPILPKFSTVHLSNKHYKKGGTWHLRSFCVDDSLATTKILFDHHCTERHDCFLLSRTSTNIVLWSSDILITWCLIGILIYVFMVKRTHSIYLNHVTRFCILWRYV